MVLRDDIAYSEDLASPLERTPLVHRPLKISDVEKLYCQIYHRNIPMFDRVALSLVKRGYNVVHVLKYQLTFTLSILDGFGND